MNHFILQGKVLYKEKPKHEKGSALIVLAIGREKEENNNQIQSVNKVIVRVPNRLTQVIERFEDGEYIELSGTMVGRVYSSVGSKQSVATINLVASGLHACSVSHLVKKREIENKLFCSFTMSGVVKAVQAPARENHPHTLFVQIERPITRNENTTEQPTAVIPIAVFDTNKLKKLEAQMSVVVTGRIHSLLRKMPIPSIPGEFEERLEVSLVGQDVRQCAIIPTKIFESRQERAERKLREKEEGEKEAAIDPHDAVNDDIKGDTISKGEAVVSDT